ncbi:hypothetical protein Poly30_44090 [Planctomycetes bacterium Poly30]|uniref:Uncharacterized protein n=1 Tax=Saltatorellus ferox TaxID=2528018 RepID=A0A518EXM9_9BACT|nr:hypothetical protein Poly30_44090 [Planctomycetes bacterium Poly30]
MTYRSDSTRCNHNIGTAKQGHGPNHRVRIPRRWQDSIYSWARGTSGTIVTRTVWGWPLPFLVEHTLALCLLATCAPGALAQEVLEALDPVTTLADRCAAGRIDAPFEAACRAVIEQDVRGHASGESLPADFFPWLDRTPRLERAATLAIANVGPKVAANLERLRAFDDERVEKYPALAVAYAAAFSQGQGDEPHRYWVDDWLVRGRAVPSMEESFVYHVEHRRDMRMPLRDAPWQVLAHLADSLVPMAEREWALDRYRSRKTEGLRDLFGAVPYTLDPKRGDAPCTLMSFLEFGGPCTHNVQFAGGVFDAFGIPSGWAGGPGHTYPYWFEMDGKVLTIHRTNELGNRNGKIRDPLGEGHVWEDRLRLLVLALNHSVEGQRRSGLAAWAHGRVAEADRARSSAILVDALRENPFCHETLSAFADATAARAMPQDVAGQGWKLAAKALGDRPYDLSPLLERAVPLPGDSAPTFAGDDDLLKGLVRRWERSGLDERALQARVWRGRALAAHGQTAEATRLLIGVASQCAASHADSFVAAALALAGSVPGAPDSEDRFELLTRLMRDIETPTTSEWTELRRSRLHAVRAIVGELEALGRAEDASAMWYEELASVGAEGGGVGSDFLLIGGGGGAPFEEAPAGAEFVGVRVTTTGFQGRDVIGSVEGLFRVDGEDIVGERAGDARGGAIELRAPDGWRVAGLVAAGSDRLDGFQLVFVPVSARDNRVRMSPWVGTHREDEELIGGRDLRIVGIRGRAGADVDALGLVGVALD